MQEEGRTDGRQVSETATRAAGKARGLLTEELEARRQAHHWLVLHHIAAQRPSEKAGAAPYILYIRCHRLSQNLLNKMKLTS